MYEYDYGGSWRIIKAKHLKPLKGARVTSIDNSLYLLGGSDRSAPCLNAQNNILLYEPESESWTTVGHMINARESHAISTIQFEDVKDFCRPTTTTLSPNTATHTTTSTVTSIITTATHEETTAYSSK